MSENWIMFVAEYPDGNTDYFEIDRATLRKGARAILVVARQWQSQGKIRGEIVRVFPYERQSI